MKTNSVRLFRGLMLLALSALPLVASPQTAVPPSMDNWVGTWILNVQKSRYGDGKPPVDPTLIRQVLKIRVSNGNLDLYVRTELADGTDVADETHLMDLTGRPHVTEFDGFKPVTETFKQIDQNTIEIIVTARPAELSDVPDGELIIKVKLIMSADRNTLRETKEYHYRESDTAGKAAVSEDPNPAEGSILVFDRQTERRN